MKLQFFQVHKLFSGFVCQTTAIPTDNALSFQKNLKVHIHVILLERGDFKLSIVTSYWFDPRV